MAARLRWGAVDSPTIIDNPQARAAIAPTLIAAVIGAVVLCLVALFANVDHDESQYVAATRLVADGFQPYRDFPYLQTPLQPLLLAPLGWLFAGHLFLASRLFNAVAIALSALMLGLASVRLSGSARAGWLLALAVMGMDSVLFAASVARNDALPFLFACTALAVLASEFPVRASRWKQFGAGVLLGLAAATKISYALPAAAVAIEAFVHARRGQRRSAAALIGGIAVGSAPILAYGLLAPPQFHFGVIDYSIDAVIAWQADKGTLAHLGWPLRIGRFISFLSLGAALPMVAGLILRVRPQRAAIVANRLLRWLIVAGIIAALMPAPMFRHYLLPVLPPLVLATALRWQSFGAAARRRPWLVAVLAPFLALGVLRSGSEVWQNVAAGRSPAIEAERFAHALPAIAARAGAHGPVAGLGPEYFVDSGLALDRRFAAGPFIYRAGNLKACARAALCPVTYATNDRLLATPPGLIVTGTEGRVQVHLPQGLDAPLVEWALAHGYRQIASPGSLLRVYAAPSR